MLPTRADNAAKQIRRSFGIKGRKCLAIEGRADGVDPVIEHHPVGIEFAQAFLRAVRVFVQ